MPQTGLCSTWCVAVAARCIGSVRRFSALVLTPHSMLMRHLQVETAAAKRPLVKTFNTARAKASSNISTLLHKTTHAVMVGV